MFKGRHSSPSEMLLESLDEFLFSAKLSLEYIKRDRAKWPKPHALGGTLGFSTTLLLFSIVDAIGSYYDGLEVTIGESKKKIRPGNPKSHFFILNSPLFNLKLSETDFDQIYSALRNKIAHNSLIGKEIMLHPGRNITFIKVNPIKGKGRYTVYLKSFYEACECAIEQFKIEIPNVVPNSFHGKEFFEKK